MRVGQHVDSGEWKEISGAAAGVDIKNVVDERQQVTLEIVDDLLCHAAIGLAGEALVQVPGIHG